jgi:hypothetical protein
MAEALENCNDGPPHSIFRAELSRLTELFEEADARAKRPRTLADKESAEADRLEVMGDFHACSRDLSDLFLLLMRKAIDIDREAVRVHLVSILHPELDELANGIIRLEARK